MRRRQFFKIPHILGIFIVFLFFVFSGIEQHTVDDIDINICSHVIYSFAVLKNKEMAVFDEWLDIDLKNYENFVALKNKNPDVKLIIALGGWTDSQSNSAAYKEMFASPTQRQNFAKY